jgi:hypothetical protein
MKSAVLALLVATAALAAPPTTLEPADRVVVQRCWLPDISARVVAASLPGGVSVAFDAATCRLAAAWTGGFLDMTATWTERGAGPATPVGHRFFTGPTPLPWRLGANDHPSARFLGYRTGHQSIEFRYEIDGLRVTETLSATDGSLVRRFQTAETREPLRFFTGGRGSLSSGAPEAGGWTAVAAREFTHTLTPAAPATADVAREPAGYPPSVTLARIAETTAALTPPRPRLLVTAAGLRSLRERAARDPRAGEIAASVQRQADALLAAPPVERRLEGRRLLGESRRAVHRLLTLALAFHLTDNPAYAERAAREMLAVADFADWNPSHFLDTAEMTFALAVGYDWLHAQLDEPTRAAVRQAILTKGVRVPLETKHHQWTRASNNWGQVCHAGMVAGALAVLEDDREAAATTVHRALTHVPRSMAAFAPNGSYPEGPGYWSYGTTYNVLLIALLESVFGESFGLDRAPGFDRTGAYLTLMTGPSGKTFNYADGGSGRGVEPAVHWLAARYRRAEWLASEERPLGEALERGDKGGRFFPLLLLWMGEAGTPDFSRLPLHWHSASAVPVAVHRSSWSDPAAVFAGIKAGTPSGPHGHMDIGSFVLDADGVRWATDLGAESYHRIESRGMNFWSMAQDSPRWSVFRQNSLSHNTLVIGGALQRATGRAEISRFSDAPAFPHTVVDMSGVYEGQAASVHRGLALLPSGEVLVRDRFTGLTPGATVRWGMVTPGTGGAPGVDSLLLHQGDKSLTLRIVQPPGAAWEILDSATPKNEWDSPNPGTAMVAFTVKAPENGTLDLAVLGTPGQRPATPPEQLNLRPPMEWSPAR